jgi:hypothetical protein
MAAVTLVCTGHHEHGATTVDALLDILRSLEPAVIFLEVRAADLAAYSTQMLETRAVHKYSALSRVESVPVDDFELPASFRRDTESLFDYVDERSDEYNRLEEQRERAAFLGFDAMNSEEFESLIAKCEECMKSCIEASGDDQLVARYSSWTGHLRRREQSMLANIYDFCRQRPETRAVFLVGAAHLSSLVEGIRERTSQEPEIASWEVWNRPARLSQR